MAAGLAPVGLKRTPQSQALRRAAESPSAEPNRGTLVMDDNVRLTYRLTAAPTWLALWLAATLAGCRHWTAPLAPPVVTVPASQSIPNPLPVPPVDPEFLWNQLVDELDDYFRIQREQRPQEVGGILMEGRIETIPSIGSTILEPWRRDSTPGFEKLHSSLQSIRRQATARVTPTQGGGFLVEVQVRKEIEDVNQPERATVGSSTLRHDGSLARNERGPDEGPITLGWITLGRDVALEQQILEELRARLTNVVPPKKPHHGWLSH